MTRPEPEYEQKLFNLWLNGTSIAQTQLSLKRAGINLDRETIRRAFVRFAGAR